MEEGGQKVREDMTTETGWSDLVWEEPNPPLLALEVEEATGQGMWAPLEAGKFKETESLLEPQERNTALPKPYFGRVPFRLLTSRTIRHEMGAVLCQGKPGSL